MYFDTDLEFCSNTQEDRAGSLQLFLPQEDLDKYGQGTPEAQLDCWHLSSFGHCSNGQLDMALVLGSLNKEIYEAMITEGQLIFFDLLN